MNVVTIRLKIMFKKLLRDTRLFHQLAAAVTIAIICLATSSSILTSFETSKKIERLFVEQGEQIAAILAKQSLLPILYQSSENALEGMDTALGFPDIVQIQISDTSDKIIAMRTRGGIAREPIHLLPGAPFDSPKLIAANEQYWTFVAPVFEGNPLSSPFDINEAARTLRGYIHVVISKQTLQKLVHSLMIENLIVTLSIAALLLYLMRILARQLARPLQSLSQSMHAAEIGIPGVRAGIDGPKDLIEMAHAFNKMMDVLDERERDLKHSRDEALRTAMLKSQFAAMVSHEVRTPLNGVIGMLDILREMDLPKRPKDCIEVAWTSARTLSDLTNGILDVSKLEAGKLELEESDFDLHNLIEEVFNLFLKQSQSKGIQLAYSFSPSVPDRVAGDTLRLRQVLTNLINNAVKFTEAGNIAVKVSCSEASDQKLKLLFEISDTGIGLSNEAQQRIFDPYSQAERSTSRKYGGTGLGLAICKHLVNLMGGEIGVVSCPGGGSTFWFSVTCSEAAPVPVGRELQALAGKRILVVEENEVVRGFLEQVLLRIGIECIALPSGDIAIKELLSADRKLQNYDLIIINSGATDEHGADLERRIREEKWALDPAILLLDMYASPFSVSAYENCIVIGKPLSQERLLAALQKLLFTSSRVSSLSSPVNNQASSPTGSRTIRVLVAEDNRTNQMVISSMLAQEGCTCVLACNGTEAVELVKRSAFDLILMDCWMPEMDGYEATSHIRLLDEAHGKRTPIIALSENVDLGQPEKCMSIGMDDYLPKPVTLSELRKKLEQWVPHTAKRDDGQTLLFPQALETASTEPSLDMAVFSKIRALLGPSATLMTQQFLEDTHSYLEDLEEAIDTRNFSEARRIAHAIKGSSGNIGAIDISRLAKDIDGLIDNENCVELPEAGRKMRTAFDALAEFLRSEVPQKNLSATPLTRTTFKILLVDDDRSTRSAIRYILQKDGFEIDEAVNGEEALVYLNTHKPDAILMDAVMPIMDGFTACARATRLPNAIDVPVLIITALEDKSSIEKAFAAGACDYIPKPIHFAALSQRIRRIINGNHAERRLRDISNNDSLTGLPNRAMFFQRLEEQIGSYQKSDDQFAVMIVNIDRFKNINDSLGYKAGDQVLVETAKRLASDEFDCVARLSGDEFAIFIVGDQDLAEIADLAQKLCTSLGTPFKFAEHDIYVNHSIGIALYPRDAQTASELLKDADTAMQRAKKSKSGFHFFESSMDFLLSDRLRTDSDLRLALQRSEFDIFYQPQIQPATNSAVSVEALLRWRHPNRGIILPGEFVPIAEESGLILQIGEWVLRSACEQIMQWQSEGFSILRVAVNISVAQLLKTGFVLEVQSILMQTKCPPSLLEFEITESLMMEHADTSLAVLKELRALGIRLCIDDFGTGYSSLAYLTQFPIDAIKIDRSFIQGVPNEQDDMSIITSIVELAHSLRLEVIAEGIETSPQEQFLTSLSCDLLQGFLFSEPIPANQLESKFLRRADATT